MAGSERERFAASLRSRRSEAGLSLAELAALVPCHRGYLHRVETAARWPSRSVADALDAALHAQGGLLAVWQAATGPHPDAEHPGDGLLELAERAQASDVSPVTLDALDVAVEGLACSYAGTPPEELLAKVRLRAADVAALLDGRATLAQRRRLLVAAGWLALLAATLHVDLGARLPAHTARSVAASLGRETGHDELGAWAVENETWTALVEQDWLRAAALAEAGRRLAPQRGSAAVQLAAQQARAAARLGDGATVRTALRDAAAALAGQLPARPASHHFAFDERKLDDYTATALAWLGDPAGEVYAHELIEQLQRDNGSRRRLATARLDLGLVLARKHRVGEAAHLGLLALDSGRLVASNLWRGAELDDALSAHRSGVSEAAELHARLLAHRDAASGQ